MEISRESIDALSRLYYQREKIISFMAALDEADQQIAINIDGRTIKFPPSAGEGLKRFVESEMLNPLQTQITELNDRILGNDAIRPIAAE